jgi:hypothetical protein
MLEKYEHFIEEHYESYAPMHESRPHSNLSGKHVLYGDEMLQSDPIGFYKPLPVHGEPTELHYHEQYPHMGGAWVYDNHYMQEDFNYEDLEAQYMEKQTSLSAEAMKEKMDEVHHH